MCIAASKIRQKAELKYSKKDSKWVVKQPRFSSPICTNALLSKASIREDSSFLICQMKYMVQVISKMILDLKFLDYLHNSIPFILLLLSSIPIFS